MKEKSIEVGLRACSRSAPCRDDYICAGTADPEKGACIPPYFVFQFRVDGHPIAFDGDGHHVPELISSKSNALARRFKAMLGRLGFEILMSEEFRSAY